MSVASRLVILTAGTGLGLYIPAMLMRSQLSEQGVTAELEVLEALFRPEGQRRQQVLMRAMREDFALARMANRVARPVDDPLDDDAVERLLAGWRERGVRHFAVWSGFWLPLLERFRRANPGRALDVDLCRIDARESASFRPYRHLFANARSVWLWSERPPSLRERIPVTGLPPEPFEDRARRLLVHGGGWGLGEYREVLSELSRAGFALDIVVHDPNERVSIGPEDRCLITDPGWHPWQAPVDGRRRFPPVARVEAGRMIECQSNDRWHPMHDRVRQVIAVVSKPGGCTLIDSLDAATPLVMLAPYGEAERANADVWCALGLGLTLDAWRDRAFDVAALREAHDRLRARGDDATGYPARLARRLTGAGDRR